MLTPKFKATKLGIAPRSQSYQRSAEIADDLTIDGSATFRGFISPKIIFPSHPLFVPGYYYASPLNVFSPSDITWDNFLANTIYVFAYPIPRRIICSKVAIHVGGASANANAMMRMALYDANWVVPSSSDESPLGMPKTLLRQFVALDVSTSGVKVLDLSTHTLNLPADLYWLALNNTDADVDLVGGTASSGVFGYSDMPINASGFRVPYAYGEQGAFPNPFPWTLEKTAHKIGLRFGFWVTNVEGTCPVG